MPRNMSFALTTDQFQNRTKDVTRRIGWESLKPGALVMGCRKCMGLKKGEGIDRLGLIRIVKVTRETLSNISDQEVIREGFPAMTRQEFVDMFCRHMKVRPSQDVTRIEFEYVDQANKTPETLTITGVLDSINATHTSNRQREV